MPKILTATNLVKKFVEFQTLEKSLYKDLGLVGAGLFRSELNRMFIKLYFHGVDNASPQMVADLVNENFKIYEQLNIVSKDVVKLLEKYIKLTLDAKTLGDTFKLNPRKKYVNEIYQRIETYAANWDYITGLESTDIVKSTLFNFINSKLYRGEQLWILNVDAALSLLAFRNCSDEAQHILKLDIQEK